ncbi:SUMF1/EgtB/PvdO family nonheme iron enzyme [Jiangella gansuensis]|uniref:SUMF1/EgtB/PvdO family nonheme iron enzyme n=1 Tax=Jiangella gansuensis TaxID=281473 RepID=UPI0004BBBA11|nr:SUMF1/EgtB/PvdO family nonheme iron enzyme [Jiangella gansuensis]
MSVTAFAAHLGVSDRMVSKWESRGDTIKIRPVNQAALDTALATSPPDAHARFVRLAGPHGCVLDDTPFPGRSVIATSHQIRHHVDAKQMVLVAGGPYPAGDGRAPVDVDAFYLDVHPVTNVEYERFVTATKHPAPKHWRRLPSLAHVSEHPVVFVSWHDATAYATWAGKKLPTAEQWEKAARGIDGGRYPWGDQRTPAKCNTRESGIGGTSPVTRFHSGVSPYGAYDMCGNTWEWTSTRSEPTRYELKGGAWTSPFARIDPATFNDASADMLDDDTGFRCVVRLDELPD